jgi:outer membrane receptor protein involved in Fe transport
MHHPSLTHHAQRLHPLMLAVAAAITPPALAAGLPTLPEIVITGDKNASIMGGNTNSASAGMVTAVQLAKRPLLRPAEVMETVPGMIVTQHSGDGKANQYFLRGFNLDHGSDFSTRVMGMPINMPSHGHGQGYMDLNFLIPELIHHAQYKKGVQGAEDGDFATSGSARIDYQRQLAAPFVEASLGANGYRRLLAAGSRQINDHQLLAGAELGSNDGPWDQAENLKKKNAILRLSQGTAANGHALSALLYQARWIASEHVPERAIQRGEIGRYGTLLANDGGQTRRYAVIGEWAKTSTHGATQAQAYVTDYRLNLYSAPSGYISGLSGDQHEQSDQRLVWGGELRHTWFMDQAGAHWRDTEITSGLQLRQDRIDEVGLYRSVYRQRTDTVRSDRIRETSTGGFLDASTRWSPWLRSHIGARYDLITADVTALAGRYNLDNGGHVRADQLSPKLTAIFGPFQLIGTTEFYAHWGQGFHSNDTRGATSRHNPQDGSPLDPVPLIVKARGSELGMRFKPLPDWHSSLSLWNMQLASELVFIGDEGITEPQGASKRYGIEWSNYYTPWPGVIIDTDIAASRARFKDAVNGGTRVPNAIPLTASMGLVFDELGNDGRWSGGLRLRYLGAYDLEESGQQKSTAFWMANLRLGYRINRQWQLNLDILNLFDKQANDIEYWGGACTRSEALSGAGGCGTGQAIDGRLVHPLEPRSLRIGVRASF